MCLSSNFSDVLDVCELTENNTFLLCDMCGESTRETLCDNTGVLIYAASGFKCYSSKRSHIGTGIPEEVQIIEDLLIISQYFPSIEFGTRLEFDDTEDSFSSQLMASIADQMEDDDEVIATSAPVVTKHTGDIKDIQIVYTVPMEELSPSMRAVVQAYSKEAKKREKVISKYGKVYDANTILKNSDITVPDSLGKVAGTKVGEGVIIDFYIECHDIAGNGDKGSIGALKFTACTVIPDELAGYTESNPDRKIDLHVSAFGVIKRMVADAHKIGILTKVLVETKRRMKEEFGEKVKAELRKAR